MGTFPNPDTQFKEGNPGGGRPKGRRSLSTIVRDILEQPIDWDMMPVEQAEQFAEKYKTKAGWEALVAVAVGKAMEGDSQAREWLRKSGYGDKLDVTSGEQPLKALVEFVGDSNTKSDSDSTD